MSDDGFDACAYMWDPNVVMRRLLSLLRQRQAYCTDNECLNEAPLAGPDNVPPSSDFFLMFLVLGFIAVMFALRPRSLRRQENNDTKITDHGRGPHDDPPVPPPAAD